MNHQNQLSVESQSDQSAHVVPHRQSHQVGHKEASNVNNTHDQDHAQHHPLWRQPIEDDSHSRPHQNRARGDADMASYPWIDVYPNLSPDFSRYPNMKRWVDAIAARPATARAYAWSAKVNPSAGKPLSDEERKHLFGQSAPRT